MFRLNLHLRPRTRKLSYFLSKKNCAVQVFSNLVCCKKGQGAMGTGYDDSITASQGSLVEHKNWRKSLKK